ncbi:MAG TPA: HDOD domain-containing protein [Planctomycetota bacterium]|nr:HDOD domain-containing protein [Planctomycetota bacterium]
MTNPAPAPSPAPSPSAADALAKIVGKVEALPTLPTVVARISQLIDDPGASAGDINDIISRDLALSAKILRLVNSAFYGFPRRISSMTHAVVILGFTTVRNIALSAYVFDAFDTSKLPFGHRNFWMHSVGTAVGADVLAMRAGLPSNDDAFVSGLLHDIGKLVMYQHAQAEFAKVLTRASRDDSTFLEAEGAAISFGHAEAGALLLENWKLPERLVAGLRFHHDPAAAPDEHRPIAAVVHLADIVTRALLVGSGGDGKIPVTSEAAWQVLGLSDADIPGILDEYTAELRKAGTFLELIGEHRAGAGAG